MAHQISQTLCSQSDHTGAFILKFCKPPYFVKHLIIKISERSFAQCFDDSKFYNLIYTVQGDKTLNMHVWSLIGAIAEYPAHLFT